MSPLRFGQASVNLCFKRGLCSARKRNTSVRGTRKAHSKHTQNTVHSALPDELLTSSSSLTNSTSSLNSPNWPHLRAAPTYCCRLACSVSSQSTFGETEECELGQGEQIVWKQSVQV